MVKLSKESLQDFVINLTKKQLYFFETKIFYVFFSCYEKNEKIN